MPPRRSCFVLYENFDQPDEIVSMPPRRSCLGYRRRPLAPGGWFQCHHGVPACGSCRTPQQVRSGFQCHHGVPAFGWECIISHLFLSFNATTAFLLPIIPRDRGLLSSLGGDVERDGDRWVRTSVGFDGHFTLSSLSHHRGSAEALSDPPLIRTFYIPKRRSSLYRMDRRSRVPSPCYASLDDPSADPRSPDFPWGSADDF